MVNAILLAGAIGFLLLVYGWSWRHYFWGGASPATPAPAPAPARAPVLTTTSLWDQWSGRLKSFWEKFNDIVTGLLILSFAWLVSTLFFPNIAGIIPPLAWTVAAIGFVLIWLAWYFFKEHAQLRRWSIIAISALLVAVALKVLWVGLEADKTVEAVKDWAAKPSAPPTTTPPQTTPARVDPACKRAGDLTLVPTKYFPLSPTGKCDYHIDLNEDGACVMLRRAQWTRDDREYGPFCKGRVYNAPATPNNVAWVRSASGIVTGTYSLGTPPNQSSGDPIIDGLASVIRGVAHDPWNRR